MLEGGNVGVGINQWRSGVGKDVLDAFKAVGPGVRVALLMMLFMLLLLVNAWTCSPSWGVTTSSGVSAVTVGECLTAILFARVASSTVGNTTDEEEDKDSGTVAVASVVAGVVDG
jgi:hypothetical protein